MLLIYEIGKINQMKKNRNRLIDTEKKNVVVATGERGGGAR